MDNHQSDMGIPDLSQLKLVDVTVTDEIYDKCRSLCGEYLAGPWSDLQIDEILVEAVEDGLSNRIYVCTNLLLPQLRESSLKADVPSKVLVRLHGSQFVGNQGDMMIVSKEAIPLLVESLHQKGLAPKIYGVFEEGRIEHFIESTKFSSDQWADEQIIDCLVRKLAEIHQLEMPIVKDPWSVLKMAEKAYKMGKQNNQFLNIELYDPKHQPMVKKMIDYDHIGVAKWLVETEPFIKSPCVYCHNDMHFGNVLDRLGFESLDDRVFIIDYDNSSYGFRAYDLAFFCMMKSMIPARIDTWGNQTITTQEEKRRILKVYIDHLKKIRGGNIDPEVDTLEHIERELDWAEVFLQYVFNAMGISKMDPMIAQCFSLFYKNMEENDRQTKLAMDRCNAYKLGKLMKGNHQKIKQSIDLIVTEPMI